jgi:hypothetical protein
VFSTGNARLAELERLVARLVGELAQLEKLVQAASLAVERGSTVAIRNDLDNLGLRVEALAASNRKEFGKLWHSKRELPEKSELGTGDDLPEQIRLQREWSAPNGGN